MVNDYADRIARLQGVMRERGESLAVLSFTDQMRYLTGWAEGGHKRLLTLFVPAQGEPAFVVPSLNAQAAHTNLAGIARVIGWEDSTGWQASVHNLMQSFTLPDNPTVLIDDELYSVHLIGLQKLFPHFRYEAADETLSQLRGRKTPAELAALEAAAILIDTIYEETVAQLREGMTESDVVEFVHAACKRHHTSASFSPLICFGANGAMPHHHSGNTTLERGDIVVIDIGCMWDDYCSDITRTVSFGPPSDPDAFRVYDIVSRAHHAARNLARPGVKCEDVDQAARHIITQEGYGPQFIHRTGHGIGLSGHEPPYINTGSTVELQPGMCFSVEPGIYLPERFGVRIENIVTVTDTGARSLNVEPAPELRVVGE